MNNNSKWNDLSRRDQDEARALFKRAAAAGVDITTTQIGKDLWAAEEKILAAESAQRAARQRAKEAESASVASSHALLQAIAKATTVVPVPETIAFVERPGGQLGPLLTLYVRHAADVQAWRLFVGAAPDEQRVMWHGWDLAVLALEAPTDV